MGVPNYIICIVVSWVLIYVVVYNTILSPKSNSTLEDVLPITGLEVVSHHIVREMSAGGVAFQENPFLSTNCVNMLGEYSSKSTTIKSAVVVIVARDISENSLIKTVNICWKSIFCLTKIDVPWT